MPKQLYNLPLELQPQPRSKDSNVLLTQLMPDMPQNKLKTIQVLLNGTQKKHSLLYIKLKPENKLLTDHLLQLQLKELPISTEPFLLSDHSEDGNKINHTLETSSFKPPKILEHVMHKLFPDLLVLLKSLKFLPGTPHYQLDNRSLSVTVQKD